MADDGLTVSSWVTLITFAVVILLCIRPLRFPTPARFRREDGRRLTLALDIASAPVLGVLFLLATTSIDGQVVKDGFLGSPSGIQPFSVVILVFALAYICISIDVTGFFGYVAFQVATRGGTQGGRLFLYLFLLSTVMTIFTSNDVVVLTVTPIVCYLTEETKTNPLAFLISTFVACNIASMALYIGNPTNIVVAQAFDINFIQYSAWMLLPTAFALLIGYLACWAVLRSDIPKVLPPPPEGARERYRVARKLDAAVGCSVLLCCLIALLILPIFAHVSVWLLTLPFAVIMIVKDVAMDVTGRAGTGEEKARSQRDADVNAVESALSSHETTDKSRSSLDFQDRSTARLHDSQPPVIHEMMEVSGSHQPPSPSPSLSTVTPAQEKPPSRLARALPTVTEIVVRLPWKLVPFSFGMFMLCEGLSHTGWVSLLAKGMAHTSVTGRSVPILFLTGIVTTLACNVMNNLPMAILFARVFAHPAFEATVRDVIGSNIGGGADATVDALRRAGMFALIVGSNLGANLTFIGSLAGLMWSDLLDKRGVRVSQGGFFKKCLLITPPVLAAALAVLLVEFVVEGYYV
ncbi:hypothetical protein HKX48_007746 [Thoreauomyces humboldtii]|nr:hypothetical protein HKX48_007746 [Thoreauomyces humboldtii]